MDLLFQLRKILVPQVRVSSQQLVSISTKQESDPPEGGDEAARLCSDVDVFSVFAATLIAVDINNIQVTRCSFTGRLDSDPDSTVHISGCPNEENMDISLMSDKVFVLVLISNSITRSF